MPVGSNGAAAADCAVAAACAAVPLSLVVCGASVKEPNPEVADCDDAEYPVMAATSWAQNCAYSASRAASDALFCPKMLLCNSDSSDVRLVMISAGGTVAARAVS